MTYYKRQQNFESIILMDIQKSVDYVIVTANDTNDEKYEKET